ncbi:MAG: hypothetical protein KDC53_05135 [Saprospiraceae bacterium]|nr:hypothetical protein [Saprospiraceae bacterium]
MKRRTFLYQSLTGCSALVFGSDQSGRIVLDKEMAFQFLGADQSMDQIILFSVSKDIESKISQEANWTFNPDFRPTDAKRHDLGSQTNILVASHGAIYKVPYERKDKIFWAETYPSCHSVELLPDGNMISANSNDHQLTLHYNALADGDLRMKFSDSVDFPFETAHAVVYDRTRNCIWALGSVLGKFTYHVGQHPTLQLIDTFPLPLCHTNGHDLYPHPNGNLLMTTHEGVLEMTIGNFAYPQILSELKDVKSVVADHHHNIFITDPSDIAGYETWQTDSVINLTDHEILKRKGARFYKVRLWEKNSFSY